MNNHNKRADDKYSDYETLLDDLYSLQKNLLPEEKITAEKTDQLPPSVTAEDVQNLEIPILSDVVDSEIDQQQQIAETYNSAQHHLFDQPTNPPPISDEQINAVVTKLMARMRPKIDQIVRDKIRNMVVERFKREN